MSVISCLFEKVAASLDAKQQAEGVNAGGVNTAKLKNAKLIDRGHAEELQKAITAEMSNAEGVGRPITELEAATKVYDRYKSQLEAGSYSRLRVENATRQTIAELRSAQQRGVPAKDVGKGLINSSSYRNAKYARNDPYGQIAGVLSEGSHPLNQMEAGEATMTARHIAPLLEKINPSLFLGKLDKVGERKLFNNVFDNAPNPDKDMLGQMVHQMHDDLGSVGVHTNDDLGFLKAPHPSAEAIRYLNAGEKAQSGMSNLGGARVIGKAEKAFDGVWKEDHFDWNVAKDEAAANGHEGIYDTPELREQALADAKVAILSRGASGTDVTHDLLRNLRFKSGDDAYDFNLNHGQNSILHILDSYTRDGAKQFAFNKMTGGNLGEWRAGLLDWMKKNNPEELPDFISALDQAIADHKLSFHAQVDGMGQHFIEGNRDIAIGSHISGIGQASWFHNLLSVLRGAQLGLSSATGWVKGQARWIQNALPGGMAKTFYQEVARSGANAERALQILGKGSRYNSIGVLNTGARAASNMGYSLGGLSPQMAAWRSTYAKVTTQDIASLMHDGVPYADAVKKIPGLREVGMTETGWNALKETALTTSNNSHSGYPDLDLGQAWNGHGASQDGAMSVHQLIDTYVRSGTPHGNDKLDDIFAHVSSNSPAAKAAVTIVRPLLGYLAASTTETIAPMFAGKNLAIRLASGGSMVLSMYVAAAMLLQLRRLEHGLDFLPWNSKELAAGTAANTALGGHLSHITGSFGTANKSSSEWLDGLFMVGQQKTFGTLAYDVMHYAETGKKGNLYLDADHAAKAVAPGMGFPLLAKAWDAVGPGQLFRGQDPQLYAKHDQSAIKRAHKEHSGYFMNPGSTDIQHSPLDHIADWNN